MTFVKSIEKFFVLIISGIAIVVVGGFMMGSVARLWLSKDKKEKQPSSKNSDTS